MITERVFTWRNPWFAGAVGVTATIVAFSIVIGFVLLPYATTGAQFTNLWDAICSAAGVPRDAIISDPPKSSAITSDFVLDSRPRGSTDARAIGRGATLAMQCAICHGSNRQGQVDTPNLDGQPAQIVYKELRDFKSGARRSAVMSPFAVRLTDQNMSDLAAFYSYLPRQPGLHPDGAIDAPLIVARGASMRNISACGSCHSTTDSKLGAPWLDGQSSVYIKAQLQAFAKGIRINDISEQMRNIARQMTETEIEDAARYYAGRL